MKHPRVPGMTATAGRMIANRTGRCPSCGAGMRVVREGLAVMHHGPTCKVAGEGEIVLELADVDQLPWLKSIENARGW